jgi:serine/threonine protein kinase
VSRRVEELLALYVEHHVLHGEHLAPEALAADEPELLEPLRVLIRRYEALDRTLAPTPEPAGESASAESLPRFEGFRTIERLGRGGGGNVYKVEDLALGRVVAVKVLRSDSTLPSTVADFLREARSLALFDEPRIVRLFELRAQSDPPVLIMEYVDGFELGEIGPSLEYGQRARVVAEAADAIQRAHELGIQHRDLKPANILLDAHLNPKILDFGLSRGDRAAGHGVGTLAYMAPEQLDPSRPIDARTDVYALGVVLYELLCGAVPYAADTDAAQIEAIRRGEARLPVELAPGVPEPLQAIALKAMEADPALRYASARELAQDLRRFLEGRPVLARPTLYQSVLGRRLHPHLEQIREWLRLKLIYPHEADELMTAYRRLEAREDDWIVHSRVLSFSQIFLYLGAFLMVCGSLLFFNAYLMKAFTGLWRPILTLGLPLAGLNAGAMLLFRRERKAVAVAFFLAAAVLLPLFLLIVFREIRLWPVAAGSTTDFFNEGGISNRQLQIAGLFACAWAFRLVRTTRTVALSAVFTAFAALFHLTVLADMGLRKWLEDGVWDQLSLHLVPLLIVFAVAGYLFERRDLSWLARSLDYASIGLFVAVIELLSLNGKTFHYLGITMATYQPPKVSDPLLLDTLAAMCLNGLAIYTAGWLMDRHGTPQLRESANLLFIISPFSILEPIAYLCETGEYSHRFDWFFLGLALTIIILSRFRQRKSFYYAGLLNSAIALWFITDHNQWLDRPLWAMVVVGVGLLVLLAGYGLDAGERRRRP